jgi:hypothetical protein
MSVPQMPQWETLMSMSMGVKGLGLKDDQIRFPFAACLSWPSQPWNSVGDVMTIGQCLVSGVKWERAALQGKIRLEPKAVCSLCRAWLHIIRLDRVVGDVMFADDGIRGITLLSSSATPRLELAILISMAVCVPSSELLGMNNGGK